MIKELGKSFSKRGIDYVEILRSPVGYVRMYSQSSNGILIGYVVAQIKLSIPPESWESEFEKHEVFPSQHRFGVLAWQYKPISKEDSITRFHAESNKESAKADRKKK